MSLLPVVLVVSGAAILLGRARDRRALDELENYRWLPANSGDVNALAIPLPDGTYRISSRAGRRTSPIDGRAGCHLGVDFAAPEGTAIGAAAPGIVSLSSVSPSAGLWVAVDHGYGIVTEYMHMSRRDVTVGQRVGRRQQIGAVGTTGRSTGPHLHFGALVDGQRFDPSPWLGVASGPPCD